MADVKYYDVILKPVVTEKSMNAMAEKKYTFLVHTDATKNQIKEAVEKMFEGTKVKSVNTMNQDGKNRRRGMVVGKTSKTKKAIVTLTADSKDICFLTICVADQCDVCCSVRIVLDSNYSCGDSIFSSLEVDDSVFLSASTALVSYSDFTLIVTSSVFLERYKQAFLRCSLCDFREIGTGHMSSGRGIWIIYFNSHCCFSFRCLSSCYRSSI